MAHFDESRFTLDLLDGVLEDDLIVIIGEDMGPIWFAAGVVGLGPELEDKFGVQGANSIFHALRQIYPSGLVHISNKKFSHTN